MKKTLSLVLAVLLMLGCMTFTAAAEDINVTWNMEDIAMNLSQSNPTVTIGDITVTLSGESGESKWFGELWSGDTIRLYDGDSITFSSSLGKITRVCFVGRDINGFCDPCVPWTLDYSWEVYSREAKNGWEYWEGGADAIIWEGWKVGSPDAAVLPGSDGENGGMLVKTIYRIYFTIEPKPEGVSVALSSNAPVVEGTAQINAGETVDITVTATGEQNCADIVLEYNDDVFEYTDASVSNVFVSDPVDNKLHILTENTADPINVLTFTAKEKLDEDTTADFKIISAKFAESISAMTEDAKDAVEMTGTSVKVVSTKHTVTFIDGTSESSVDYYGEQKIAAGDIPEATADTGYKFNGWKYGETVYTKEQLTNMSLTDDITFTADYSLDVEVEINEDYVHGTEDDETSYTEVIVTGDLEGYTYDGKKMRKLKDKTFIIIVEGTADASKIAASDEASESITVTEAGACDVNATGAVDIADARAVFNCMNMLVSLTDYYEVYIRADVNGDGKIDTDDVAAVINELK